jgi:hypothetical protein
MQAHARAPVMAILALAAGCARDDLRGEPAIGATDQEQIVGENDLVPVLSDGANVPDKYRPLLDAFGLISVGCTATHIGDGLMLTAGHCLLERTPGTTVPSERMNDVPCAEVAVTWGVRVDTPGYLTSKCDVVLALQWTKDRDYAIARVSPVPRAKVDVHFAARPENDTGLTMFSHPRRRPLEWSKTCPLKSGPLALAFGIDKFLHQCDAERGSSGAPLLDDTSLDVIGIMNGSGGSTLSPEPWNIATFLANTPIGEFVRSEGNAP